MNLFIKTNKSVLIILLFCLIIRLIWLLIFNPALASDATWYYEKACMLATNGHYTDDGHLTAFYPIGYPAFLAFVFKIFGCSVIIGRISNLFLYLTFIIIFYLLSFRLTQNRKISLICLILLALYPNHISYVTLLYSENIFLVTFTAAIYFYVLQADKKVYSLLSGTFFGLSVLIRPAALFIPVIFIFFPLYSENIKEKIQKTLLLLAFLTLTLMPWLMRNNIVFDEFVWISTTGGYDLLIGNNPHSTGNYSMNEPLFQSIPDSLTEPEYDRFTKKLAIQYIIDHPAETVKRIPAKIFYFIYPPNDGLIWNQKGVGVSQKIILKIINRIGLVYCTLLFLILIISISNLLFGKNAMSKKTFILFSVVTIYYLLVSIVFFGESRFHFHLIPLAMLLIAQQITVSWKGTK